ncbi:MAG: hypothetical protein ACC628_24455 [Pirellulaceae bacterium]
MSFSSRVAAIGHRPGLNGAVQDVLDRRTDGEQCLDRLLQLGECLLEREPDQQ